MEGLGAATGGGEADGEGGKKKKKKKRSAEEAAGDAAPAAADGARPRLWGDERRGVCLWGALCGRAARRRASPPCGFSPLLAGEKKKKNKKTGGE